MAVVYADVELRQRHPGQAHVISQARRFNVLMCGRRFGKTALGIDLAAEAALAGQRVGWFAPTYKYLEEAWREIVSTLIPLPQISKSEQEHRIQLPTGGVIECWSMDTPDPGRGRFYDLAIVDEAGLVPDLLQIWNSAIRLTLADRRGGAWFLGTPKVTGGFTALYNLGQGGDEEWASWRMPMDANPFIAPAEIQALKESLPESDYRREVLGEPVDDSEHPIGLQHIAACIAPLSDELPVVWGVDLARSVDSTVTLGLDALCRTCRLDRWKGPWGLTRGRLNATLGQVITYADSTGVGDPIVEDLQRDGRIVKAVVFTARVKQQMVEGLIAAIQQHRISFPDGWLRGELESLTAERTAVGTRYCAPEGLHDDGVMALALAHHAWRQHIHPERVPPGVQTKLPDRAVSYDYEQQRIVRVTPEEAMAREFARGQPLKRFPLRTTRWK